MKKVLSITKTIFTLILIVSAVGMMIFTIISVTTFDRNDRNLFGFKAYIVRSDSMSSVEGDKSKGYFNAGDLIIVKEIDPSSLKVGDIISYTSTNSESFGETITHKIKKKTVDANGKPGFITYGTSTGTEDTNTVLYPYILGKYTNRIKGIGKFFAFLKTTPGYIICIFLPFLLLIVGQVVNSIRLFKKYKAEQLAEIEAKRESELAELQAERKAIETERKRQEEMMRELLKLQKAVQSSAIKSDTAFDENSGSAI